MSDGMGRNEVPLRCPTGKDCLGVYYGGSYSEFQERHANRLMWLSTGTADGRVICGRNLKATSCFDMS